MGKDGSGGGGFGGGGGGGDGGGGYSGGYRGGSYGGGGYSGGYSGGGRDGVPAGGFQEGGDGGGGGPDTSGGAGDPGTAGGDSTGGAGGTLTGDLAGGSGGDLSGGAGGDLTGGAGGDLTGGVGGAGGDLTGGGGGYLPGGDPSRQFGPYGVGSTGGVDIGLGGAGAPDVASASGAGLANMAAQAGVGGVGAPSALGGSGAPIGAASAGLGLSDVLDVSGGDILGQQPGALAPGAANIAGPTKDPATDPEGFAKEAGYNSYADLLKAQSSGDGTGGPPSLGAGPGSADWNAALGLTASGQVPGSAADPAAAFADRFGSWNTDPTGVSSPSDAAIGASPEGGMLNFAATDPRSLDTRLNFRFGGVDTSGMETFADPNLIDPVTGEQSPLNMAQPAAPSGLPAYADPANNQFLFDPNNPFADQSFNNQMVFGLPGSLAPPAAQAAQGSGASATPANDGTNSAALAAMRQAVFGDFNNFQQLYNSIAGEVGFANPQATQAYVESVMNRSLESNPDNPNLLSTITDPHYYAGTSTLANINNPASEAQIAQAQQAYYNALQGSNVSNYATGNEQGEIGLSPGTAQYFQYGRGPGAIENIGVEANQRSLNFAFGMDTPGLPGVPAPAGTAPATAPATVDGTRAAPAGAPASQDFGPGSYPAPASDNVVNVPSGYGTRYPDPWTAAIENRSTVEDTTGLLGSPGWNQPPAANSQGQFPGLGQVMTQNVEDAIAAQQGAQAFGTYPSYAATPDQPNPEQENVTAQNYQDLLQQSLGEQAFPNYPTYATTAAPTPTVGPAGPTPAGPAAPSGPSPGGAPQVAGPGGPIAGTIADQTAPRGGFELGPAPNYTPQPGSLGAMLMGAAAPAAGAGTTAGGGLSTSQQQQVQQIQATAQNLTNQWNQIILSQGGNPSDPQTQAMIQAQVMQALQQQGVNVALYQQLLQQMPMAA